LRTYLELEGGRGGRQGGRGGPAAQRPARQHRDSAADFPAHHLNAEYSHGFADAADTLRTDIRQGARIPAAL